MEWNKEEAIRAKEIAEKKMENKEFIGAQKVARRAQQLYPDLDDISQMIMVCDVHCSAESKVFGNEKDWYGILQVEPTADEALIRKQYRKFALLLHPDKNKFHGAADAFKLVSEAQKLLLDREKRMSYDNKYKAFGRSKVGNWASQNTGRQANFVKQPWVKNDLRSNVSSQFMNQSKAQSQSGFVNRTTFWTMCPFCGARYEYYRDVVNKLLRCKACNQSFTGYEINAQGVVSGTKGNQPAKMEARSIFENSNAKVRVQEGFCSEKPGRESSQKTGCTSGVSGELRPNANTKVNAEGWSEEHKTYKKMNSKKSKKQVEESSESCGTGGGSDSDEDIFIEQACKRPSGQNFGFYNEQHPRRSTRSRKHVSYNENLSDDDELINPLKRAKCTGSSPAYKQEVEEVCTKNKSADLGSNMERDENDDNQKECYPNADSLGNREKKTKASSKSGTATKDDEKTCEDNFVSISGSSPDTVTEPEFYEYMDPEFSDFDKNRKAECFAVGQIWAVYDTLDAMPRFYACIRKVISHEFKMQITWLEPDPDDKDEKEWVDSHLPVSCGKYKRGVSEDTEDLPMFSHLVSTEKVGGRGSYKMFPRKGETWALFKDWDIKWHSEPDCRKNFEYEFVEVLSDYAKDVGTHVAYLGKIKGFACLFGRMMEEGMDSVLIPRQQLFRFSHRVPSFQMTGEERMDVPKGSFELDPASLPPNLKETVSPENLKVEAVKVHRSGSF